MDMKVILIAILALAAIGCGSSVSTRQRTLDTGEGGEAGQSVVDNTGGSATGATASVDGSGGQTEGTGGTGGTPENTGGTGNIGGGCEPWDCTNVAINLSGWTPESDEAVPEACGLVRDPCTGMMIDCGGCNLGRCGEPDLTIDIFLGGSDPEGTPNICGNQCVVDTRRELENMFSCSEWLWLCADIDTSNPQVWPDSACTMSSTPGGELDDLALCCDENQY